MVSSKCNLKHFTEQKSIILNPINHLLGGHFLTAPNSSICRANLRERADTLGRIADVPHLDVRGGDGEDQTGGRTVFD